MCLIAVTNDKELLNIDYLESAHINNPHGWGIVYAKEGRLYTARRMSNFATFRAVMEVVPKGVPIAVHFRWATHGAKNLDNTHPFDILSVKNGDPADLCFMHNGTISGTDALVAKDLKASDTRSDTAIYVDEILRPIIKENPDIVKLTAFKNLVERDIGGHNKLVFFYGTGEVHIFNRQQGHENTENPGVWFSNAYSLNNNSYRENKVKTYNYNDYYKEQNSFSSTAVVPIVKTSAETLIPQMTPANDYIAEEEITDAIKKELCKRSEKAYLIKPDQRNICFGLGWVRDGSIIVFAGPELAVLHEELIKDRKQKETIGRASGEAAVYKPSPVQQVLDLRLEQILESSKNTGDFRLMNQSEIMEWVVDYPRECANWLLKELRFTGNTSAVESWVQANLDKATEAIFQKTHFNNVIQMNPDTPVIEDHWEEYMNTYGMAI